MNNEQVLQKFVYKDDPELIIIDDDDDHNDTPSVIRIDTKAPLATTTNNAYVRSSHIGGTYEIAVNNASMCFTNLDQLSATDPNFIEAVSSPASTANIRKSVIENRPKQKLIIYKNLGTIELSDSDDDTKNDDVKFAKTPAFMSEKRLSGHNFTQNSYCNRFDNQSAKMETFTAPVMDCMDILSDSDEDDDDDLVQPLQMNTIPNEPNQPIETDNGNNSDTSDMDIEPPIKATVHPRDITPNISILNDNVLDVPQTSFFANTSESSLNQKNSHNVNLTNDKFEKGFAANMHDNKLLEQRKCLKTSNEPKMVSDNALTTISNSEFIDINEYDAMKRITHAASMAVGTYSGRLSKDFTEIQLNANTNSPKPALNVPPKTSNQMTTEKSSVLTKSGNCSNVITSNTCSLIASQSSNILPTLNTNILIEPQSSNDGALSVDIIESQSHVGNINQSHKLSEKENVSKSLAIGVSTITSPSKFQKKTYNCWLCPLNFMRKCKLDNHVRQHAKLFDSDDETDVSTSNKTCFAREIVTRSGKKRLHGGTCKICLKTFHSVRDLQIHMSSHQGENQTKSTDKENTSDESEMSDSSERKKYKCKICSNEFSSSETMEKHINEEHPVSISVNHTNEASCTICTKSYANNRILRWHISRVHRNGKIVQRRFAKSAVKCKICFKRFNTIRILRAHITRYHSRRDVECDDNDDSRWTCNICSKSYFSKHGLVAHKSSCKISQNSKKENRATSNEKGNICSKVFPSEQILQWHLAHGSRSRHETKQRIGLYCRVCKLSIQKLFFVITLNILTVKAVIFFRMRVI